MWFTRSYKSLLFSFIFCLLLTALFGGWGCSKSSSGTNLPGINSDNNRLVGASASEMLSAGTFTSLKIEIQSMAGFQPDINSINNLVSYLNTLINKPGGISVVYTSVSSSGGGALSLNDIATIEKNSRTVYTSGSQLGLYFLITDGAYTQSNVLGVAYRNTSLCIFGKTIHDNSGAIGQASRIKLESTVMEHESGHVMGLVDLGTSMQINHKDGAHGNHCDNNNCLMYYASETTDILGFLLTGSIPVLDANCRADLHANGGK